MTRTRLYRSQWFGAAGISLAIVAASTLLFGCGGGQQVGGATQSLNGDIAPGYNTSLSSTRTGTQGSALSRGAYPMIETSFQLGSVPGDPFDYEKVLVEVTLKKADGNNVKVPAFFDGGTTWRMRYTPTSPGKYDIVDIKLNGETVHEAKLEKRDWTASGTPKPGFVRIDRGNHAQFALDNGDKFYPIGHNVAWQSDPKVTYDSIFAKMHTAGENWSSLWLDQRDGKLIDDASKDGKPKLGEIDLDQAKRWDSIVSAAQKNDIYVQLVLENSDAFSSAKGFPDSSNVHPGWDKNPLNSENGGSLKSPDSFFTNPTARTLEKRKLFYMLARWGYSPNIMAIELFHDVQNTDAGFGKKWDDIAMWHKEMAIFAKTVDANHHLLTTSSAPGLALDSPVWETVDVLQGKVYASDLASALTSSIEPTGKKLEKPYFVSEFGAPDGSDPDGTQLHIGLWSGLMSGASGAAQYWDWDNVEKLNLYDMFKSVTGFVTASSLAEHPGLPATEITIDTTQRGALSFGPGASKRADTGGPTEFVVGSNGVPPGIERLAPVLEGKSSGDKPLTFQTSYQQAGAFILTFGKVSKAGAHVSLAVDGKAQEHDFSPSNEDHTVSAADVALKAEVPSGSHTITVTNTGSDWITLRRFTLTNYAPGLAGIARAGKDYAIAWIYNRDGIEASDTALKSVTPATGLLKLPGLQKGKYRVIWWDTAAGKTLDSSDLDVKNMKDEIALTIPPISRDTAMYIIKAGTEKAKLAKNKGRASAGVQQTSAVNGGTPINPVAPITAAPGIANRPQ